MRIVIIGGVLLVVAILATFLAFVVPYDPGSKDQANETTVFYEKTIVERTTDNPCICETTDTSSSGPIVTQYENTDLKELPSTGGLHV